MRVKHILVQHRHEAEDLARKLKDGQSFEDLAQKYSLCSSGPTGGDLGDLSKRQKNLDQDFWEACQTLAPTQISGPTRTRFGYHLILRVS